jgi:hypothetical protein
MHNGLIEVFFIRLKVILFHWLFIAKLPKAYILVFYEWEFEFS